MSDANLNLWKKIETPPEWAMKRIEGGRLAGMTNINPQWRKKAMTELFGPCGMGWRYEIAKLWTDPGSDGQVIASAIVKVYYKQGGEWSEPVVGVGGSKLVEKEKSGAHTNDEGYKMAVTDALSTALALLGMGSKVYEGQMDGSKYSKPAPASTPAASGGGTGGAPSTIKLKSGLVLYRDRQPGMVTYLIKQDGQWKVMNAWPKDMDNKTIEQKMGYAKSALEDPSKSKYHEQHQEDLDALQAEMMLRLDTGEPAPDDAPPPTDDDLPF
jgi:hypothetical protein